MAAARRPAARVGPATSPPSRFPQVNYCDFATLLAALSATVASALSSAVAAALASTALSATLPAAFSTALSAALSSAVAAALAAAVAAALLPAAALTLPAVPSVSPSPSSVSLSPLRRPCRRRRLGSVRVAFAASVRVAVAAAFLRFAIPAADLTFAASIHVAVAVAAVGLAFAASVLVAVAAAAVGIALPAAVGRVDFAASVRVAVAASVRVAVAAAFLRLALPAASSLAVAVAAIGLAFAASVRVAVAASAVGFAFVACSVRVALAAVTIRHTHSLHICKFFLMYTAVQPLAISGQLKASTLSPKPLCPALAAVLFGAMAGVEAPNPGAAEPVQRQHQQPLSLILKTVPAGISKIVLKWIPGEWHLISRTGSFNNQVMSPLNVHVRGLRQRPSDQPSRAICDPSTPSRLGRGRPPPAAPLTSPPR